MRMMTWASSVFVGLVLCGAALAGEDLAHHYPCTIDDTAAMTAFDADAELTDVWNLTRFSVTRGDDLVVELGPSKLVLAASDGNVLWAAVIPEQPGTVRSAKLKGDEHALSVWLRFHPARLAEVFPADSVAGRTSDAGEDIAAVHALAEAYRLSVYKMKSSFHVAGRAALPQRDLMVVDVETAQRPRRFFIVNDGEQSVQYMPSFEGHPLPISEGIAPDDALRAFDETWETFDREYAMFTLKPDVDWAALRDQYRPHAEASQTHWQAAFVIARLVRHLRDQHVWVKAYTAFVPSYFKYRPINGSSRALEKIIPGLDREPEQLLWGRTEDGIGYVNIFGLGQDRLPARFDAVLERLKDTKALIIDLRFNGGGNEFFAQQVAGRFVEEPVVYAQQRYRSGPAHEELSEITTRVLQPRGPWRYEAPVLVLIGQHTFSSAEAFALMLAQCPQAETMGDRTAGSSGNPRTLLLPRDISVNMPRWMALRPDGVPLEGNGVVPDISVESSRGQFTAERDPVLEAALEKLRAEQPQ